MKRALRVSVASLALLAGCDESATCPAATLPALAEAPAFAVVTSDYTSTAIALLDAEGELVDEAWVDSGSAEAGIVAALSGDVSLPSAPLVPGELTVLDRFGVDVISRFDLRAGGVIAQIDVQLPPAAGGSGFRSNPQDVVALGEGTLLVSRFEPNFDPDAPSLDEGNDLVFVTEDGPASRMAMEGLDASVDGTTVFARPGRIAPFADGYIVGLGRLGPSFQKAGPGAVALVTVDPQSTSALDLPGFTNCPSVRASPDGDAVIALCQGFEPAGARRAGAGLVRIVEGPSGPEVAATWRASDHPEQPVPTLEPIPLGGGRVAVPALDESASVDQLMVVDLESGEASVIHTALREFVIGVGAYDPDAALLLVPDADQGILRFDVDGASLTPMGAVDPSPCRQLAPREIGRLLR
jgi:hypothetical protein